MSSKASDTLNSSQKRQEPRIVEEYNIFKKNRSILHSGVFFVESFLLCAKKDRTPDIHSNTTGIPFSTLHPEFQAIMKKEFEKKWL